jgi:hypothetical protein
VKRIILVFSVCIILSGCSKKYFEGKILYRYQYLDHQGNDITPRIKQHEDTEQHYFINLRNYKSLNEKGELTQLYNSSTNQYFFKVGLELQKMDGSTPFPKTFKAQAQQEKETILGYPCKSISVIDETGRTTFLYSRRIKINTAAFSKHRFGNWNNYLGLTKGSLPLKFIVVHTNYTLVATASGVTPMKLADEAFDLATILHKK